MRLKEYFARLKTMVGHNLRRSVSNFFLRSLWFEKTPSIVMTGHFLSITVIICQAKSMIANGTRKLGLRAIKSLSSTRLKYHNVILL